jgi:hypothetical protein
MRIACYLDPRESPQPPLQRGAKSRPKVPLLGGTLFRGNLGAIPSAF